MTADTGEKRALEPVERLSEILFGLIMVLTFTGSLSVAASDRAEVKTVLIGAIGCNIAWGLIDGVMFLMGCLHERGTDIKAIMAVRRARSAAHAHAAIRSMLPSHIAEGLPHEAVEQIRGRIAALPEAKGGTYLTWHDIQGAAAVFLVVVASTLPVILPFIFMHELNAAMRASNAIAVAMLALIGFAYGRASGIPPVWTAAAMVLLGAVLVGVTIALGG